jgi:proline dehydrogenase
MRPIPTEDGAAPLITAALKSLARDATYRQAFLGSALLRQTLSGPASRYTAPDRAAFIDRACDLISRGYSVGAELVGEGTTDPAQIDLIVAEYIGLIDALSALPPPLPTLNFDLSNLGLATDPAFAERSLRRISEAAAVYDIPVILSMETAALVDPILSIFQAVHKDIPTLGLTVQAFRPRTDDDLGPLLDAGARLRLVKGVYDEPRDVIVPRGPELDQRYLAMARRIAKAGHGLQLATHDAGLIERLLEQDFDKHVEYEMLHGVRPDLAAKLRDRGTPVRIYATYGTNFWLHFLHRLAEHPDNVTIALADWADPDRRRGGIYP